MEIQILQINDHGYTNLCIIEFDDSAYSRRLGTVPYLLNFIKTFRKCGDDTFVHLIFPQKKIEMNQFTTNSSFQVSENLCLTLYIRGCTVKEIEYRDL